MTVARIIKKTIKITNRNQTMTNLKSILMTVLLSTILMGATSCDNNLVYEDAGDCTPKIQFIFKKHRHALQSLSGRETDAFYSTVETVHLFVYDAQTGQLVLDRTAKTENLKSAAELKVGSNHEKCYMPVDLKPGKYHIVAWCGLDESDNNNAFHLTENASRGRYAECQVKLSEQSGHPLNLEKYDALYHGTVREVEITLTAEGQIIPLELTKNTNDIAVWVQHTTKTFNEDDYEVVYTDANGSMKFEDNTMNSDRKLEYRAHTKKILTASTEYNGEEMETGALVAHISTSRLMEAHLNDAKLEVRTKDGQTVFSIPFLKYVLELQTLSSDNQYYLDCEDTYNCSFYLSGESGTWMPSRIIINNWVLVPNQKNPL